MSQKNIPELKLFKYYPHLRSEFIEYGNQAEILKKTNERMKNICKNRAASILAKMLLKVSDTEVLKLLRTTVEKMSSDTYDISLGETIARLLSSHDVSVISEFTVLISELGVDPTKESVQNLEKQFKKLTKQVDFISFSPEFKEVHHDYHLRLRFRLI